MNAQYPLPIRWRSPIDGQRAETFGSRPGDRRYALNNVTTEALLRPLTTVPTVVTSTYTTIVKLRAPACQRIVYEGAQTCCGKATVALRGIMMAVAGRAGWLGSGRRQQLVDLGHEILQMEGL